MAGVVANIAEIEYAVMLAVLNFQTEFMKSNYSQVQVHVCNEHH
jgi:NADH:ubiquinone oxidoreductase subunit E